MKKLSVKMISIILACMMVITMVPFTGSRVNAEGELSTKIIGAPKDLKCKVHNTDNRQIDVDFTPDLECGIDKSCGIVIAASTDNKQTWQVVDSWSFSSGQADLKWNTYALCDSSYFKMDYEKTYYVKAYYVESDGKKGPDSNICGPFGPVEDESKIPAKVEEASKTPVKITGDDAGVLKTGTTVTFERPFYKLTFSVKEIKGTDITFDIKLDENKPYDSYLSMYQGGSFSYINSKGNKYDTDTILPLDMSQMAVGCTKITIPVTATLLQKYDLNQKKYKFEETFYCDVAPQAPGLIVTKADKKSVTLGKAYSIRLTVLIRELLFTTERRVHLPGKRRHL